MIVVMSPRGQRAQRLHSEEKYLIDSVKTEDIDIVWKQHYINVYTCFQLFNVVYPE